MNQTKRTARLRRIRQEVIRQAREIDKKSSKDALGLGFVGWLKSVINLSPSARTREGITGSKVRKLGREIGV